MDLDDFIITVFCWIDEAIPAVLDGQRLRQRGPAPRLCNSEVVTMEIVGEYLGLEQEQALFAAQQSPEMSLDERVALWNETHPEMQYHKRSFFERDCRLSLARLQQQAEK
jgi:hypothetical protein